ncbi:MAG: HD domain-containing phosphohydrolase [Desulfovibrionaceae bacterium]
MKNKVLIVDDDAKILSSFQRILQKAFEVDVAASGDQALEMLSSSEPYAIVISDFRMPGLTGVEFLSKVKVVSPDTVRIILTGYADLETAIAAVNEGNIYKFLTKPCNGEDLKKALVDSMKQYRLVTAEREVLEKTLAQTVELLTEILSLTNKEAFEKAHRMKRYVRYIAENMDPGQQWMYEMACMLSFIGCILVSDETLGKIHKGKTVTEREMEEFRSHPMTGYLWLEKIPRLKDIAEMVLFQGKGFDGSGFPTSGKAGFDIPLGGRILKAVGDFDNQLQRHATTKDAFEALEEHIEQYDPEVLYFLEGMLGVESRYEVQTVRVNELRAGMILHQTVYTKGGTLVLRKNMELTDHSLQRLRQFAANNPLQEPIKVLAP